MLRTRRSWIIVGLLLTASIPTAWSVWQYHRYKHFAVHEPGMVYRAAWLEPDAISELIEEYQIRTVVNLCNPGEMGDQRWVDEERAVVQAGARLVMEPMAMTIDPADPSIPREIGILQDPNNYPMLVHCQHGVTRTAKFLLMYDVLFRGISAEESLNSQPLLGRDDHNVNVRAFGKEFERRHKELYPTASARDLRVLR